MKLLLFSDIHVDQDAARALVRLAADADILVGAGDFGNLRRQAEVCIDILREADKPAVLVAGNNESTEELTAACRHWPEARVLHGTGAVVEGIPFFGLGGGVPVTPFGDWSYDFSEEEATTLLKDCPADGVLVTHSPPWGAVDRSSRGDHLGSRAVLKRIEQVHPRLVVCGHIHGSGGQQARIGETTVINAGPKGVQWLWL
jgi:Icc-related predicted phosphoesterase